MRTHFIDGGEISVPMLRIEGDTPEERLLLKAFCNYGKIRQGHHELQIISLSAKSDVAGYINILLGWTKLNTK